MVKQEGQGTETYHIPILIHTRIVDLMIVTYDCHSRLRWYFHYEPSPLFMPWTDRKPNTQLKLACKTCRRQRSRCHNLVPSRRRTQENSQGISKLHVMLILSCWHIILRLLTRWMLVGWWDSWWPAHLIVRGETRVFSTRWMLWICYLNSKEEEGKERTYKVWKLLGNHVCLFGKLLGNHVCLFGNHWLIAERSVDKHHSPQCPISTRHLSLRISYPKA
jgi:hypothetical protein